MYKFVAKLDITMPGQPPSHRKEEHVFGVSNAKLFGLNFIQGFAKIMLEKLETEKWIDNFLEISMKIQNRLIEYQKEKCNVKYEQFLERV